MSARRAAACAAAVLASVVVGSVLGASPVGAHASIEVSDPADGEVLDAAPSEVTFTFDEGVRVSLGGLRVVDQDGERVDTGEVTADGQTATVALEPDLPDGVYTAAFRVISADGHPVRGGIVFQVGDAAGGTAARLDDVLGDDDEGLEVLAALLRAVAYAGALLAAGGGAFLVLVHDGGPGRARLVRWATVGAAVGALALLLQLPVQAALATGLGLDAIFESGVFGDVVGDGVGPATWLTVVGLGGVVFGLRSLAGALQRWVVLVCAAIATGAFALTGHARTSDPAWLVVPTDAVHTMAAAAWFGGLVLLGLTLVRRLADDQPGAAAAVLDRFSLLATVAVVVAGVAGLVLAWAEVRAVDALDTTYGVVLLAKLAVLAVVAAVAGWNHWRLLPAVRAEQDDDRAVAVGRVRTAVRAEAIGLVVVLAITAVLVNVVPARTAAGIDTIYSELQPIGDDEVNLVVDPNQAGENELHLYFYDETGAPLTDADEPDSVEVLLTPPGGELGTIEREPSIVGPGHYSMTGNELSMPGQWSIVIRVRDGEFGLSTAEFAVRVGR